MLTPNWPDQNAGNGRCGQRSGWRAIVWLFRLITDDCQSPGETFLAQCFCGAEPSEGGADNDNAAGALKCCHQIRYFSLVERALTTLPPPLCRGGVRPRLLAKL